MELAASTPRCRLWAPKTRPGLPAKRRRRRPRFQRLCSRSWRPRSSRLTRPRRAAPPGRSVGRSGAPAVNVNVDGRETGCTRETGDGETGDGETGRRGDGCTRCQCQCPWPAHFDHTLNFHTKHDHAPWVRCTDGLRGGTVSSDASAWVHGGLPSGPPHTTTAHHRTPPHTTAHHRTPSPIHIHPHTSPTYGGPGY